MSETTNYMPPMTWNNPNLPGQLDENHPARPWNQPELDRNYCLHNWQRTIDFDTEPPTVYSYCPTCHQLRAKPLAVEAHNGT